MPGPSVRVRALVAGYRGQEPALRGLDLAAGRGALVLLGPTGAGKSTLLRVLAGQLPPRAGTVVVDGEDAAAAPLAARARLGYVPQEVGLPGELTLYEYLCELLALDGVRREVRGDRARAVAGQVHLRSALHRRLHRFSGGMRRRALIAQALLRRPRVLLADEPTAGLDPVERLAVLDLLRALAEEACVVAASHFTSEAADLPGHVAVLDQGRLAWTGPTAAFVGAATGCVWELDGPAPAEPGWLAQPSAQPGRLRVVGIRGALPVGRVGRPAEPTVEDAYFATLLRARAASGAAVPLAGGAAGRDGLAPAAEGGAR